MATAHDVALRLSAWSLTCTGHRDGCVEVLGPVLGAMPPDIVHGALLRTIGHTLEHILCIPREITRDALSLLAPGEAIREEVARLLDIYTLVDVLRSDAVERAYFLDWPSCP